MRNIRHIISGFKADWNNHLIGFIATIVGILIAFQLQDWADSKKEKEKIELGIKSLKIEISEDKDLLYSGLKQFKFFNGYTDFIVSHLKTDSTIVCTDIEWDSLKAKYQDIFSDNQITKRIGKNQIESQFIIRIDFFPPKIHTDNWEALKSSGVLTSLPLDKLVTFTKLYSELNRNWTGTTPDDFLIYARQKKLNIKEFNHLTNNIEFDYKIKLDRIDAIFDEIMKY